MTWKSVLIQLYYSLAYPYINYNVCSYAGTYETHLHRILLLQKRLIRIINRRPFLEHTDELFFSTEILKIQDVYKLNIGLYMYDNSGTGQFARTHSHNTRHKNDLLPTRARLAITQNSINVIGPNIWNTIPDNIRALPSKTSFKKQYKTYLLSFYSSA